MKSQKIPDWLMLWIWKALMGEIYPNIRAVAASFSKDRELKIRYYLDRKPKDGDFESLSMVVTHILANTSSNYDITAVKEECLYNEQKLSDLDPLDSFIYKRREYLLDEIV